MPAWWHRLLGKPPPPKEEPLPDHHEVDRLRGGLRTRMQRETFLISELRRIEDELRERGR